MSNPIEEPKKTGIPVCPRCGKSLLWFQRLEQYHNITKATIGSNGGVSVELGTIEDSYENGLGNFHCEDHGLILKHEVVMK